jgi:hypothetical protein
LATSGAWIKRRLLCFFLVPGIGEKDVHTVQAAWRQHVVQHLHRVVLQDADVFQALFANAFEQGADAGRVHFAAEEVFLRQQGGNLCRGFTHAEADFQDGGGGASERGFDVQRRCRIGQKKLRPRVCKSPGLAGRGAAGAQDKAADGAQTRGVG